jgi:spermidine synthase
VGQRLSWLYLANILGSAAGSLTTGFVFMEVWRTRTIGLLMALLGLAMTAGLLVAGRVRGRSLALSAVGLVAATVVVVLANPLLFEDLYVRLLYKRLYASDLRFDDLVETRSGVVAVTPAKEVFGGGVYDGVISTGLTPDRNSIVRAYAMAAMHPRPREVLAIGLSGAAWAQVLVNMPGVERLTVVEINPGYLEVIRRHPEVASLLENPRVDVAIDDGRRWLNRHPDRAFDVIVANTTFHWRAHATTLLSREYLELVREHLRPGGIYAFNTTESEDAMKTAFTVFPHGLRHMNFVTVSDSPIQFDVERWRRALVEWRIDGKPVFDLAREDQRRRLDRILAVANTLDDEGYVRDALEPREQVLARVAEARVITDDNMVTEWRRLFPTLWGPWLPEAELLETTPLTLRSSGGREVLASVDGDTAVVEPDRVQGFLDGLTIEDDVVTLWGWAADVDRGRPADSVALFVNGRFLALGTTGSRRPDLAAGFGKQDLNAAGFSYALPLRLFKHGSEPNVRAFGIVRGGAASELTYGDAFPWTADPAQIVDDYTLIERDEGALLVSAAGDSLPIAATSLRGFVDAAVVEGNRVSLVGWAADVDAAHPADTLLVFLNDRFLTRGTTGVHRPDLVDAFGKTGLTSAGFRWSFPRDVFGEASEPRIRVFALAEGGRATELRYGTAFPWPPGRMIP